MLLTDLDGRLGLELLDRGTGRHQAPWTDEAISADPPEEAPAAEVTGRSSIWAVLALTWASSVLLVGYSMVFLGLFHRLS